MTSQYGQPLHPEVGVVALVADGWNPHWEARHFVLSRLAKYFHVVWIDYPYGWRDNLRVRRRSPEFYPAPPAGLQIYRPETWLPLIGRPRWLAEFTSRRRLEHARDRLRTGCTRLVLYIWRPEFADALGQIQSDLSIYHIDDEYSFSPHRNRHLCPRTPAAAVRRAGFHPLMEKKRNINPHTEFVPNGVDYHAYATPVPEPAELQRIPHPCIGYRIFEGGARLATSAATQRQTAKLVICFRGSGQTSFRDRFRLAGDVRAPERVLPREQGNRKTGRLPATFWTSASCLTRGMTTPSTYTPSKCLSI